MTRILLINNTTNKLENISVDERPVSEINIEGYTVLDESTTSALDWEWDGTDWISISGIPRIGQDWDGTNLTIPKPAPKVIPETDPVAE